MEEAPCPSATDGRVLAEGCELDGQSTLHQRAGSRRALAQRKHCVGELHGHVSFRSAFRPALLVAQRRWISSHPANKSGARKRACRQLLAWHQRCSRLDLGTAHEPRFYFVAQVDAFLFVRMFELEILIETLSDPPELEPCCLQGKTESST